MEKDAAQQKLQAIQIDQEVSEAELQDAYLEGKQPEKIQAATLRMRVVKYKLNKIQQLEAAGRTSSSPNDSHYVKVLNRGNCCYLRSKRIYAIPAMTSLTLKGRD